MSVLLEAYVDLHVRLEEAVADPPEERAVEAIRDAMDRLWYAMSDDDHNTLDGGGTAPPWKGPHRP